MTILSRDELIALFKAERLRIEDSDNSLAAWADRKFSSDNPFQQCSLDLRVGDIYVPETEEEELGGAANPIRYEHLVDPGQTIMIRTKEKISLPLNVCGMCFAPVLFALKAVLVTNMGHVDPGYSGHLHFTAINMGKGPYTFRRNDPICTMVLFKLDQPSTDDNKLSVIGGLNERMPSMISDCFSKLAKDFVDVETRARGIAESIAKTEVDKLKWQQTIVPIIVALLVASVPLFQLWISKPWDKEITNFRTRLDNTEKRLDLDKRVTQLENSLLKTNK